MSTTDQQPENQLAPLREYVERRGWVVTEYVDAGVSGTRDRRPALDELMAAARVRRIDVVVCVRLDRLARSVRHLVNIATELEALNVDLVVVDQAIDATTPAGRLLFHILTAIAEFERSLIVDPVRAGLDRARRQGKRLGRPRVHHVDVPRAQSLLGQGASLRAVARALGVHPTAVARALAHHKTIAAAAR